MTKAPETHALEILQAQRNLLSAQLQTEIENRLVPVVDLVAAEDDVVRIRFETICSQVETLAKQMEQMKSELQKEVQSPVENIKAEQAQIAKDARKLERRLFWAAFIPFRGRAKQAITQELEDLKRTAGQIKTSLNMTIDAHNRVVMESGDGMFDSNETMAELAELRHYVAQQCGLPDRLCDFLLPEDTAQPEIQAWVEKNISKRIG